MYLVTGGTGFVGRHVVAALCDAGAAVRVLARRPDETGMPPGVDIVGGDVTEPDALDRAVAGVREVVHLAGRLPTQPAEDAADFRQANVEAVRLLARAARGAGVQRIVHCSTGGVYGTAVYRFGGVATETMTPEPTDPYDRSKLDGERALVSELTDSATGWVILRPAGLYGPGRALTARFLRDVRRRRIWLHARRDVMVHPTYVIDLVTVVQGLLDRPTLRDEVFNVGGECALSFRELIAHASRRLRTRVVQVAVPGAVAAAALGAHLTRRLHLPGEDYFTRMASAPSGYAVDTTKVRAMLGVRPVPLTEGLDRSIEWAMTTGQL